MSNNNTDTETVDRRVLFTPFYQENPYQEMYESALRERGVSIIRLENPTPFSLPLLHAVRNRVDAVHFHWLHPFFLYGSKRWIYKIPGSKIISYIAAIFFLIQVILLRYFCDSLVWTIHNTHNHEKRYLELDYRLGQSVIDRVDVVQVWDENTASVVQEEYKVASSKIVVIPHGNFAPKYEPYSGQDPRADLGIDSYDRVFMFFGMIRPYKNVPELIRAFNKMNSTNDCLLIAGNPMDDQMREEVVDAASTANNILMDLRYIPDEQVPKYFAAADICVFSYENIFNSGSVLLAMTFGTPFVAPRMGSIPSVAPEGNILYSDLASGLKKAHSLSQDDLERIGKINGLVASSNHSWDHIAEQTVRCY